ncbi:hypothetical protein I3842_05G252500 [Carya illinoinensis]|uniref:Non-specific serine/threonine protein kinase n=1 Tax=Carya illinoinensis TaxID=32201 RepID=A0A922F728_CARIL|nr:hypothetical protein I3842_05G252500 [Carya illinoinensis]
MGGVNLSLVINWLNTINMLPSLSYSHLSGCELSMPILPVISNDTLTSLLLGDHLNSSVFPWLFKYNNTLAVLNLYNNYECQSCLQGMIPKAFENLHRLEVLYLSNNNISGEVLDLTKFPLLEELNPYRNRLNLQIPTLHLNPIKLSSCKMGSAFLLLTQRNFSWLNMSGGGISYTIPNWFWNLSSNINFLNLSHNQIKGSIPFQWFSSRFINFPTLDLSYNCFNGILPLLHSGAVTNGSISNLRQMSYLDLSNNLLSGELPSRLATMKYLIVLNLANNNLSRRLLDSIGNLIDIQKFVAQVIDELYFNQENTCMGRDKPITFGGSFPTIKLVQQKTTFAIPWPKNKVTMLVFLMYMRLILKPLKSISTLRLLKFIDLSSNRIKGEILRGITSLSGLIGFNLSRNLLTGFIPQNTGGLESLDFLDFLLSYLNFSNNHLSVYSTTDVGQPQHQLQSFNAFAYTSNKNLGLPLPKRCLGDEASRGSQEGNIQEHASSYYHLWFETTIALGFIVGF